MRRLLVVLTLGALFVVGATPAVARTAAPAPPQIGLRCVVVDPPVANTPVVKCHWTQSAHPGFYAYKLVRAGGHAPRTIVFRTTDIAATSARDHTVLPNRRYAYRVVVLGPHLQTLQTSNIVYVHT